MRKREMVCDTAHVLNDYASSAARENPIDTNDGTETALIRQSVSLTRTCPLALITNRSTGQY